MRFRYFNNRSLGLCVSSLLAILLWAASASAGTVTGTVRNGTTGKPAPNVETVGSPPSASGHAPGASATAIVAPSVPSQPTAVTEPSAALAPDAPITEQLRNLANGKFDPIIGSAKDRAVIDAFYAGRNYAPLWITEGKCARQGRDRLSWQGRGRWS